MKADSKAPTLVMSLVFLLRDDKILLAFKLRGFGEGLYNGAGGKLLPGESVEDAARRECFEEIGVTPGALESVARLGFINQGQSDNLVYVFTCRDFDGVPSESEEMRPQWFNRRQIPFEQMWPDDRHWLPRVLAGEKLAGRFYFDERNRLLKFELAALSAQALADLK